MLVRQKKLTSSNNPLVAVVADDHGRLELQTFVPAQHAGLPLAKLTRVTQRLCPSFVQFSNLLRVFLLRRTGQRQDGQATKTSVNQSAERQRNNNNARLAPYHYTITGQYGGGICYNPLQWKQHTTPPPTSSPDLTQPWTLLRYNLILNHKPRQASRPCF